MKESLKTYVCEKCGGELKEIGEGRYLCPYCRVEYFKETKLPDELILDLHSANRARSLQRFEDALNEYDRIVASYGDCFDAYWGATLSDYGIQYEKDYDGRMIPTVHRFSETPVFENSYYVNAITYCNSERERERIERSAAEIERIRAEIKKTVGTQEPYDIFLCYKETPVGNPVGFTSEFYWAAELYGKLMGEGYRVFFAKESLPASKGDYEAHIFPALKSAKLMLILTTSVENVESVWVKNEWSRFIRFSRENPTAGKRFKVIQSGFRPESLPRELKKEQVLNHDSMGWVEQLYGVIRDTFRDKEKEEEERRRREADKQAAYFAKMLEEERKRWAAEELKKQEEEKARREAEEQKKRNEEARKREDAKNEERIRELERQLAEAKKQASSPSITFTKCAYCGSRLKDSDNECPVCGMPVKGGATASASSNLATESCEYEAVLTAITPGKKLDAVRAVKEALGVGLADAKNLVEKAPCVIKSGISKETAEGIKSKLWTAGVTVTVRGVTPPKASSTATEFAAERAAERAADGVCDIILEKVGPKKLDVISIVRKYYGLGLKDAKDFVESAPRMLQTGASKRVADMIKSELETAGATVTVKSDEFWDTYNELKASVGKDSGNTVYRDVITDSSASNTATATKSAVTSSATNSSRVTASSSRATASQSKKETAQSGVRASSSGAKTPPPGATYIEKQFSVGFYKGYAINGSPNGHGVMAYTNGDVYEGNFVNGNRSGAGVYTYAAGSKYDGNWENGTRTGYGKYIYANGKTKEGRFENGIFKG